MKVSYTLLFTNTNSKHDSNLTPFKYAKFKNDTNKRLD